LFERAKLLLVWAIRRRVRGLECAPDRHRKRADTPDERGEDLARLRHNDGWLTGVDLGHHLKHVNTIFMRVFGEL
jgi:hypothetical protein